MEIIAFSIFVYSSDYDEWGEGEIISLYKAILVSKYAIITICDSLTAI